MSLAARSAAVLDVASVQLSPLHGGCVAEVFRVDGSDGIPRVAKVDRASSGHLAIEGRMLGDLAPHLPVPGVIHADDGLLLMEFVPNGSGGGVEEHAAGLLANLHGVTHVEFGYDYDPDGPELLKMWPTKIDVRIPELIAQEEGLVQQLWIDDLKRFNDKTYRANIRTRIGSLQITATVPTFLL